MTIIQKCYTYEELKQIRTEPFKLRYELLGFNCYQQEQIYEYYALDNTHKIIVCNNLNYIEFIFFDEIRKEYEYLNHLSSNKYYYKAIETAYCVRFDSIEERNSFLKENVKIVYYKQMVEPLVI